MQKLEEWPSEVLGQIFIIRIHSKKANLSLKMLMKKDQIWENAI